MELYVNCTGLQTSHSAVTANVAKLIISSLRISKIKLADDLKAVISFSILFYWAVLTFISVQKNIESMVNW